MIKQTCNFIDSRNVKVLTTKTMKSFSIKYVYKILGKDLMTKDALLQLLLKTIIKSVCQILTGASIT